MKASKIYPAIIKGLEIIPNEHLYPHRQRRLQIDVYTNEENPAFYMECYIPLKKECSEKEPCGQLYTIFAEAERWGDVMWQEVGVTLSLDDKIQSIVRTPNTITEEELIAKNCERKRVLWKIKHDKDFNLPRRERLMALIQERYNN